MDDNNFGVLCSRLGCLPTKHETQESTINDFCLSHQRYADAAGYNDDNSLLYLRARYYNDETGTFLSPDPVEGTVTDPLSLNRYSYARNNPINNTDPSGTVVCSDLDAATPGRRACVQQVLDLYQNFGISLTEDVDLSSATKNRWTSPRVNNVYTAVQAINNRLGGNTRKAIGDTELQLIPGSDQEEAAVTTRCNLVSLYLNVKGDADHVHTVDNLIHEFGHVITVDPPIGRTINSSSRKGSSAEIANRPLALWLDVANLRGFDEGLGWGGAGQLDHRQHAIADVSRDVSSAAEVVADMFLYSVQGYPFSQNDHNIGQARSSFINGGNIPNPDGNPLARGDGSVVYSAGITTWAGNATCSGTPQTSAAKPSLLDDPYLKAANSGWCNFT